MVWHKNFTTNKSTITEATIQIYVIKIELKYPFLIIFAVRKRPGSSAE